MRIVLALSLLVLVPAQAFAASEQGEIGAAIIDPLTMTKMEAKMFCIRHDYTRKCQQLEVRWKEEKRQRKQAARKLDRGSIKLK